MRSMRPIGRIAAISLLIVACLTTTAQPRTPGYLILGGELGNSSASSTEDIRSIFPRLADMGLNTVLMPVSWEIIEPEEGKFDFILIDEAIATAENNGLKIVPLWFGAWKNSMSCYAPAWVKKNERRFPRAVTEQGKPLEILSAFSDNVLQADLKAFNAFLDHIQSTDKNHSMVMIQIENEIGMLESPRDHSNLAEKEYAKGVPEELSKAICVKAGSPWKEAAEAEDYADEMFMAWNYAKYVENLARSAKDKLPETPVYVNAALDSRGRRPGQYPSAGPLARLRHIWNAGAPSVDFISPDLYDPPFAPWFEQYAMSGNPLFIPEIRRSADSGTHAFYAVGQHDAIGFSPFSIENASEQEARRLKEAYEILEEAYILKSGNVPSDGQSGVLRPKPHPCGHPGCKPSIGFLFDSSNSRESKVIEEAGLRMTANHFFTLPWDSRATDGSRWPDGGGMLIKLGEDEYILAGTGLVVKWETLDESEVQSRLGEDGFLESGSDAMKSAWKGTGRVGILSCDEVRVNPDGTMRRIRRLNGDETHQGRHVRIGVDDYKILHIKLYRY